MRGQKSGSYRGTHIVRTRSTASSTRVHTDKPCVFVDIRTTAGIDVCEYPDSGKINILPYQEIYQGQDKVGYYLNEDKPAEKWPPEIIRDAAAGD